ncbi:hypothetical protein HUN08_10955 [Gordonia sp. X0973]|uniref:hypothetical protein n=1 Tax=Gordonia sp. X0973 TaxID=2742602 RepID=UPI0013EBC1B5|nr:hypothetical protein [Gordonia sp. X0973]QKT07654.1 hypothetical protein HUN08_10955 [Gordonia sp. X0973]
MWELVRQREFPEHPTRLGSLFCFADATAAALFGKHGSPHGFGHVWEIEAADDTARFDMRWLDRNNSFVAMISNAQHYWRQDANESPIWGVPGVAVHGPCSWKAGHDGAALVASFPRVGVRQSAVVRDKCGEHRALSALGISIPGHSSADEQVGVIRELPNPTTACMADHLPGPVPAILIQPDPPVPSGWTDRHETRRSAPPPRSYSRARRPTRLVNGCSGSAGDHRHLGFGGRQVDAGGGELSDSAARASATSARS